jgi:hypothetical protein
MIQEIQLEYLLICPLDIESILAQHDSLRKNSLGDSLLYSNLAIFLELAHHRAGANWNYCMITKGITI